MWLQMRMYLLIGVLFGILFALILGIGTALGGTSVIVYVVLAVIMVLLQYLISPYLVSLMMKVKYVSEREEPELHQMVAELAQEAGIPKPRVGVYPRCKCPMLSPSAGRSATPGYVSLRVSDGC